MSLNFTKLPYVDGETVIPARNLNEIQDAILDLDDNKVEKEPGKGLSTNDYSNTDKSKVDTALQATTSTTLGPSPIVTFDASAADMPLKALTVNIEPVQSGSGDPSPENVRPISGWTGCNVINGHLPEISWTENKAINASGTIIDSASNGKYSSLIPYANTVVFDVLMAKNASCRVHGYDANGDWVEQLTVFGVTTSTSLGQHVITNIANESIKYIRISLGNASYVSLEYVGTIYPITFPTEAGTVYGGTLTINADGSGELVVDRVYDSRKWSTYVTVSTGENTTIKKFYVTAGMNGVRDTIICNLATYFLDYNGDKTLVSMTSAGGTVYVRLPNEIDGNTDVEVCYKLVTPLAPIRLTAEQITTLLGTNNIWADTGDVTVTYGAYLETVKAHADRLGDSILSAIAPLETSYTATRDYAVGSYLFVNTDFYKVIAAIQTGETITVDTNVKQTTVAEQLLTKPSILG